MVYECVAKMPASATAIRDNFISMMRWSDITVRRHSRTLFFLFAFIVFNPCFTIQVYHGVFTEFYNEFYSDVCGVHEEYRQIYFPWASSWSAWKMRLRKFVMLTVFV